MASKTPTLPLIFTLIFAACVCALLGAFAQFAFSLDAMRNTQAEAERSWRLIKEAGLLQQAALEDARATSADPKTMDGMRATTHAILREAERVLVQDNADAARNHSMTVALAMSVNLIAIVVLSLFYGLTRRHFDRWIAAEEVLRRHDENLESVVAARTRQLSEFSRHLIRATDREKAKLARELHDELGSHLTAINLDAAAVEQKLKTSDPALALRLQRALDSVRSVVGLNRRIIENLRPSALDNMELAEALRGHCEEFTQRTRLPCATELDTDLGRIDPDWSIALFCVAQEALANAARHAEPADIRVSLRREDKGIRLMVVDDGIGVPSDALDQPAAHGLLGMRERISMLGGSFDVRRGESGSGTVVEAFVPFAQALPEPAVPAG